MLQIPQTNSIDPVTEDEWSLLFNQTRLDESKRASELEQKRLGDEKIAELRDLATNDLYFLAFGILGYNRLSPNLHGNLCKWLEHTSSDRFRNILLPRGHFKTTICTITDTIQRILRNPSIRILLAHETEDGASRFLYSITAHFTSNELLMALFPELVPVRNIQRMNKTQLDIPHNTHFSEPTIDAMGVGAKSQGRHYDVIKLDDIFGDKARDSHAEMESTIQWFDEIQAFFVSIATGKLDLIGTRYSLNDVYAHAQERYGSLMLRYIRRVEEGPDKEHLEPIFPEEITKESLEIVKKNKRFYAAQMANDPHEGLAEFDPKWKRFYNWLSRDKLAAFHGIGQSNRTVYDIADFDRLILIDPAVTGLNGIIVTGTDDKKHIYILEAIKDSFKPPEFSALLFKLVMRWAPRLVSIEEVVFSALYKPWMESEMKLRNLRFAIQPYKRPRIGRTEVSKTAHIGGLANYFEAGDILMCESQHDLLAEYDNFGASDNVHMLDALAQGPYLWVAGGSRQRFEKFRKLEDESFKHRDVVTGYSKI